MLGIRRQASDVRYSAKLLLIVNSLKVSKSHSPKVHTLIFLPFSHSPRYSKILPQISYYSEKSSPNCLIPSVFAHSSWHSIGLGGGVGVLFLALKFF